MQVRGDPPHAPGVFIIVRDEPSKVAFVGSTSDLRQRATIWAYNFKKAKLDRNFKLPVKGLARYPLDGWFFAAWDKVDEGQIRELLVTNGYTILNKATRHRGTITYKGKAKSFAEHCRELGVNYETAYARWRRGKNLDEVFTP